MTRGGRVVLIVLIGVPILVACVALIAIVTLRREHRASSPVTSAPPAETAATASTTPPPIDLAAPVESSRPPPPAWLTKVLELPSNPNAIKPTSVQEGTGKTTTLGGLPFTSLDVYEYDVPPLTEVSLTFNPADIRQYTLTFDVPKSFDLPTVLRMKKLCDVAGDTEVFTMKKGLFETVCVTVDHGDTKEKTNEVSIQSFAEVRQVSKDFHSSWLGDAGDPERCGCP